MKACYKKYLLKFKRPSGTSRGILTEKETWYLILNEGDAHGIGECGLLKGLSIDDLAGYEDKLRWVCKHIEMGEEALLDNTADYPSIQFGIEQAFLSLKSKDPFLLFKSDFTEKEAAITINGLIWMGDERFMLEQVEQKLNAGFSCLKLKIGALDFEQECAILKSIRQKFSVDDLELRVDANGAFSIDGAFDKLKRLAEFEIHSIEQPIQPKNWGKMAELCQKSPLPIALDEELIGITTVTQKGKLLQTIQPHYIILKPSLLGGYKNSMEWIQLANKLNIGWWITSALESNIGLNAIAQWTFTLNNIMPQGLGTGSLYTNNFTSPLTVERDHLIYRNDLSWQAEIIQSLCT